MCCKIMFYSMFFKLKLFNDMKKIKNYLSEKKKAFIRMMYEGLEIEGRGLIDMYRAGIH